MSWILRRNPNELWSFQSLVICFFPQEVTYYPVTEYKACKKPYTVPWNKTKMEPQKWWFVGWVSNLFHLAFFRFYGFSFQGCNPGGYTMSWVPLISTIFIPNCGCFEVIPSRNPKQKTPPRRSTRARADSVESDLGTPQNLNAASPFWRGIRHSITTGRGKSCLGLLGGWVWRKICWVVGKKKSPLLHPIWRIFFNRVETTN